MNKELTAKDFKVFAEIGQAQNKDGEVFTAMRFNGERFLCNPRVTADMMISVLSSILRCIEDKDQVQFKKMVLNDLGYKITQLHNCETIEPK